MTKKRKQIGLVLGGGAARGYAHVGVLSVLEEEGLEPDFITGTSMGAIVGALRAQGRSAEDIMETMMRFRPPTPTFLLTPVRPQLVGGIFHKVLGELTFEDLKIPFRCTVTDIDRGETIILKEGNVADALMLSSRIPLVFPPVIRDGRTLVDGGLLCNLPVEEVLRMGAERVLAVHLGFIGMARFPRARKGVQLAIRCVDAIGTRLMEMEAEKADVVLRPSVKDMFALDFRKARTFFRRGRETALAARKELHELWNTREKKKEGS